MNNSNELSIMRKLRSLPPERMIEVEDFVDFLQARDLERNLACTRQLPDETHDKHRARHQRDADTSPRIASPVCMGNTCVRDARMLACKT